MSKGRVPTHVTRRAAMFVVQEAPIFIEVFREVNNQEVKIGRGFHTNVSNADRQITGRDLQTVFGSTGPQAMVMHVPYGQDIQPQDIVWTKGDVRLRYRVLAIDEHPQGLQVAIRQLQ